MKTKLITLLIVGLTTLTGTATIFASGGVEPLKNRVKNWVEIEAAPAESQDDGEEHPEESNTEGQLPEEAKFRGRYCNTESEEELHPQAMKIDGDPEDIMTWFCEDGYGFGEIKQGYKISLTTGVAISEVLSMREFYGWGQIKQMCDNGEEGCDSTFVPRGLKKKTEDGTTSTLDDNQPENTPWENPGKGPKNKPEKPAKGPKK